MSQRAVTAQVPPSLGSTGQADWEAVPLAQGSSVIDALRARGLPVSREILAAIAQVNGIRDFRRIAAGTPLWLPRRASLGGDRAAVWREAYSGITPDNFATVDRDRAARRSVRTPTPDGPRLHRPASRGPVPQQAPTEDLTVDPLDVPVVEGDARRPPVVTGSVVAPEVDPEAQRLEAQRLAARTAAPAQPVAEPPNLQQLAGGLLAELRGPRDRDRVLRLVYALMSHPGWTNEQARRAYATLAQSQNEWQLIADLRASGLSSRDVLRASEYVWNDERTPFDAQVSPPIRVVLAAIGFRERGFWQLDAGVGTADATLEDALWEIVETIGVDTANAIIASRAGNNPAGVVSNARFTHDPQNPGIVGRLAELAFPHRRPAPLDGSLQPAPQGTNPLADIINTEYARWKNVMGGFSGAQRDRLLAILRMPPGTDRRSFDIAMHATSERGEDFLKLFEGKTREQMAAISAAFNAGFGSDNGGSLDARAVSILDHDQMQRYQALLSGTRSDPAAAARYIALTLRARARDAAGIRAVLKMLGSTESGTPTWDDVVAADFQINPERSQRTPLAAILQTLGNDPVVQVVRRDNANPDEPAGIARRIMASRDPVEIARLLKRTDGDLFNEQELTAMNQAAARLANSDAAANPSALYRHVAELCGAQSEAALIVQRVGGPRVEAPLYDEAGRLSPAAQLFFALQRADAAAVSNLLSRTPFTALSGVERAYAEVANFMGQAGVQAPGGTPDIRAAVGGVLRGEERRRALQFLTGFDVTSPDAANQSGGALAAAVTADLQARCAWLLQQFDHEREPLEERLMQFQITLEQVLVAVQQRRQASGQSTGLTEEEQVRLGEAVRRLVGQRRHFEVERDALARTLQDTTILVSTTVASIALTVGTFGAGAPASAALWATAMNIARVAAVGTIAGLATAPLQGGDHPYLTSGARGFAYGAFAGLGASTPQANAVLARLIPGTSILANTARNGIVMATVWGGLSASGNIGVEFESTEEALRRVGGDALRGALFGLGFAGVMGLSQWLLRASGAVPAPGNPVEQLNQGLQGYVGARDLRSMERAFGVLSGGQLPPPGVVLELSDEARNLLAQGIKSHLAALARTPATTVAQITEQASWVTSLTLYAQASGIQLQGETLQHALTLLQRMGVAPAGARLSEAQIRSLLTQTAERLRDGERVLRAAPAPGRAPPVTRGGPVEPGIRLVARGNRPPTELRSWAQVSLHARQAATRPLPIEAAMHARSELTLMNNMLNTPQGQASLAAMRGELGPITAQDLDAIRRSYVAAIGRADRQIVGILRAEAAQIARAPIPAGDIGPIVLRLGTLSQMQQRLAELRAGGMTLELFDAGRASVAGASRALDTTLAARVTQTFADVSLDPAGRLAAAMQLRDGLRAQGIAAGAPETFRAFNEAIQRLQAAVPRRAA